MINKIFKILRCYGCASKGITTKKYILKIFYPKEILCELWYCNSCIAERKQIYEQGENI